MRILGLDPSLSCTGWAIIEKGKVTDCGTIKTSPKDGDFIERLRKIDVALYSLLLSFDDPLYIAIEDVFVNRRNIKTSIQLAKVHGAYVARLMAYSPRRSPIKVYAPKFVKQTITGSGAASKEQVLKMVQLQAGYKGKQLDESDAIAVALTCEREVKNS